MDVKNRARENFPPVLLTLLSIVQAIALEEIWHQMQASLYLYHVSWLALFGWLQIVISLLGIILVWLLYADLVMRFRFTPKVLDTILPFFVGLMEFYLIAMATPETLGQWTMAFAALLAIVGYISQKTMRRARQDGHNEAIFKNISPATKRDLINRGFFVVAFFLAGLWLLMSGDQGWVALAVLLAILGRMSYLLRVISRFWRITGEESQQTN